MADTAIPINSTAEKPTPLIAELWARARDLHLASLRARGSADETIVSAMRLQLNSMALLACSMPASCMADVGPKVMFAALFRDQFPDQFPDDGSYTLVLVERAIAMDMRRLQGPPLTELFASA